MQVMNLLDRYGRQARLYPAVLILCPLLVIPAVNALAENLATVSMASAALVAIGYGLTHLVRTLGKRIEEKLFARWGGPPTTRMLRWSDSTLDETTKARYHAYLRGRNLTMPTPAEERADAQRADEQIASAVSWLRNNRREEQTYRLVHIENAAYGFRRNMFGAKPLGVAIACVVIAFGVFNALPITSAWGQELAPPMLSPTPTLFALTVGLTALMFWVCIVTQSWVRAAAEVYAKTLLGTCDTAAQ